MKIKDIIYTAAVIQDRSLISEEFFTHPIRFAHHCTIKFGNIEEIPDFVGTKVNFIAEKFYNDSKASALLGYLDNESLRDIMRANNQNAHITISCEPNVKPVYSNELILNSRPIRSVSNLIIPCLVGAYCSFYEHKPEWIF